jgi:RNA polymerase sigma factor (sigma-70 family)
MQPRLLKHPARLAGASLLRLQDDARLVALAREGHDPAFAAIVDRYGRQLERYCARLLGPGRAEDAVQQAFVNAHAAMRASEQELALKPWLYRIAHNAALNILRASREEDDALDLDRPGAAQTPEVVELRERLRETFAAIQALPAAQRDALLLRELEGRSHEEIALALGVSEGGARQHLHRARVAVRAAASAVTPYPVLARVLSAAAAEGGRSADLVSGAGLGAGAGAMKVAAGVLAAGAIAGGAVGVHQHRSTPAHAAAGHSRSTTAPSEANGPSATPLEVADITSAGATASHGRGRDQGGARGHDRGHQHGGGREHHGSVVSGDHAGSHGSGDHSGSSGSGSSGGEHTASKDDSSKSGSGTSGSGSHDSGSGSGSGSDDTTTEASHEEPTTTTSDGGSSGSGSADSLSSGSSGSSGSDDGGLSTTSTTSTEGSGSGGSSGSSDWTTTTSDH